MKIFKHSSIQAFSFCVILFFSLLFSENLFSQNGKNDTKLIQDVTSSIPINDQIIVKFRPDLINREIIDNQEFQEGKVIDFIAPEVIELFNL